ncbi:MAG: polysaccharide lyase family protein [Limisphaerales bacterium]
MKTLICLGVVLLGWNYSVLALDNAAGPARTVFQIGVADRNYEEFALARNYQTYPQTFPHDADFVVGQSDPKKDWPWIHPGPTDAWADSRPHVFKITFDLPEVAAGYYRLVLDFVDTHAGEPPVFTVGINGTPIKFKLPPGHSDESLTNPKAGKNYSLQQVFPATLLQAGKNTITLANDGGSWALYDDVRLESGAAAPVEPVRCYAEGLPWLKRSGESLQRLVKVSVENLAIGHEPASIAWKAGTRSGEEKLDLRFGHNEVNIPLPAVEQKTTVELALEAGGKQIKATTVLQPTRKWKVFIVPTVHTDIGYTDLQERVMARHAENTMQALAMADKYPCFNWDFETFWQLDCFLRAHPEKTEEIFRRLREGRMGLSDFFGNMLTGLCSHEALNRATLPARDLANRGGFDFTSVILDDVPGAVGSLPTVLANAGIKYFIEGVNGDRAPHATEGLQSLFYWEGPDGSRVLSHLAGGYGMAGGLISSLGVAADRLPGLLASHENAGYPYDAVLVNGAFSDNQGVAAWLPEVVEKWNAQWEYPKLILSRPEDFFRYIEQNFAAKVPVLRADFGCWWEDGAGSSALETALSRRAEERAVTAEMLHSLAAVLRGEPYPKWNFDELWRNILLYNEHTWGAAGSISAPESEQTVKQWEVKGSYARQADAASRELLERGMVKLAGLVPATDLVVFNPLAWSRTDLVTTAAADAVQDVKTERKIPCQALPEGGSCFVASDLPSVGYRSYRRVAPAEPVTNAVSFSGAQMESEFYRVSLDPKSGGLNSILDKETGRELIDAESEYRLGELIYVSGGEGSYAVHSDLNGLPAPKFTYHRQTGVRITQANGPVFGELASEAAAEKFPRITLRVRLYRGLKRVDVRCELDKEETTAKEAVYIAFPFAFDVERGGLWLEYPDAITEPLKDQHSSACRDWYAVQRWLAASDGEATVVLSPLDSPLVTLGGLTASTWPRQLSLKRAHVFAYVMNNYWHTNYKASQGGRQVFRFSLTSARGGFSKREAVARGWEMYAPAVAQSGGGPLKPVLSVPAGSLVGVEPAGLPLLAIKQAEDEKGFVFRVCDFAGVGGSLKLTLPKAARETFTCDLVETHAVKQDSHGKTVTAPLKPFAPATVKVQFR